MSGLTMRYNRREVAILFVCCISILLFVYLRGVWRKEENAYTDERNDRNEIQHPLVPINRRRQQSNLFSCPSNPSFVYVKTHKTGSGTLAGILKRLRARNKSLITIPKFPPPYAGGYPGSFRRDLTITSDDMKSGADILLAHFRFDETEVREIMNPQAKYISIMRNPKNQFQSSFYYFYYSRYRYTVTSFQKMACQGYPYLHVTGNRLVPFSQYLELAGTKLDRTAPWYFRSLNNQAFDLGLDPAKLSREYVLNEAKRLDTVFDLVLILDHLLESLVLLKTLFCMEWEEIIPTFVNSRQYDDIVYTEKGEAILRKLTFQDQILYDYFNASLWRKIRAYGEERMAKDVQHLKSLIEAESSSANPRVKVEAVASNQIKRRAVRELSMTLSIEDALTRDILENSKGKNETLARSVARHMIKAAGSCPHYSLEVDSLFHGR